MRIASSSPAFVRSGELRKAEWSEFNLLMPSGAYPPQNEMREKHIVPLASQTITVLKNCAHSQVMVNMFVPVVAAITTYV